MPPAIRTFVDTSALFAAIWSEEGGGRVLLRLAESGAITVVVSRQVLTELERAIRRKAPDALPNLAILLERIRMEVAPDPGEETLGACRSLVAHEADAAILAAAWASHSHYFVTLDRQHFLENAKLREIVPFGVGTPGDCLAWFRKLVAGAA
jgi:predicted nucleic acid-binding protein